MPPSSAACPHDGLLRSGTALFERRCGPFRAPGTPGVFAFGLRLVAWDGTALDVPDTLANAAEFGDTGKNGNPHAPHAARSCARSWSISCRRAVSGNAAASEAAPVTSTTRSESPGTHSGQGKRHCRPGALICTFHSPVHVVVRGDLGDLAS